MREDPATEEIPESTKPASPTFCVHMCPDTCECLIAKQYLRELEKKAKEKEEQENAQSNELALSLPLIAPSIPTNCTLNPLCPQRAETPDEVMLAQHQRPSYKRSKACLNSQEKPNISELTPNPVKQVAELFSLPDFGPFKNLRLSVSFEEARPKEGIFGSDFIPTINLSGTF